jgi:hypothetical protein
LLGVVLRRFLIEPQRAAADGAAPKSTGKNVYSTLWRTPTVVMLLAAFLCANFVALVVLTWMPKFLYGQFHLSLAGGALLIGGIALFVTRDVARMERAT